MTRALALKSCLVLALSLVPVACGGGNGNTTTASSSQPAAVHTLAYVVTQCHESPDGFFMTQSLRVQQGEHDPVTVFDGVANTAPLPALGLCGLYGGLQDGKHSIVLGAFHRVGVTPDGSGVVFEVTDDFSFIAKNRLVPSALEGFYYVRADGSRLHRLGPASRDPDFRAIFDPTSPIGVNASENAVLSFSRDGTLIVFPDIGKGPSGEDAGELFTQNVFTDQRTQLTHFPFAAPTGPLDRLFSGQRFLSDGSIHFASDANFGGLNQNRELFVFRVNTDGSDLRAEAFRDLAPSGGQIQPNFIITGTGRTAFEITVPGMAVNPANAFGEPTIVEVAVQDEESLLQLTNFHRADTTFSGGDLFTLDGQQVIFNASADPLGTNPTFNCQIFSIDVLGSDLRQLTHFTTGVMSTIGCAGIPLGGSGCVAGFNFASPNLDAQSGAVVFDSSCDPFGTNANASDELFAMGSDGSGLRQLTHTQGMVTNTDGSVSVEYPGPYASGPHQ